MLQDANTPRSPINKIGKHQATFFDHVIRKNESSGLYKKHIAQKKTTKQKKSKEKRVDGLPLERFCIQQYELNVTMEEMCDGSQYPQH